jgi:hypothetical protein
LGKKSHANLQKKIQAIYMPTRQIYRKMPDRVNIATDKDKFVRIVWQLGAAKESSGHGHPV